MFPGCTASIYLVSRHRRPKEIASCRSLLLIFMYFFFADQVMDMNKLYLQSRLFLEKKNMVAESNKIKSSTADVLDM